MFKEFMRKLYLCMFIGKPFGKEIYNFFAFFIRFVYYIINNTVFYKLRITLF